MSWGTALLTFAVSEIPKLVEEFEEGQEVELLAELASRYSAHRTEQIADRSAEIAEGRAEIDARLAERKLETPSG